MRFAAKPCYYSSCKVNDRAFLVNYKQNSGPVPVGMVLPILLLSACATNNATRAPDVNLTKLKTFYVVRLPEDERGIEKLIALTDSITKSGLFAKVSPSGARYKLAAFIGKVDQPMLGFSVTVRMEVSYSLTDTQSSKSVWSKSISSEYTARTSEAFAGVKRLRLANEGAARENIQQAIAAMAALTL